MFVIRVAAARDYTIGPVATRAEAVKIAAAVSRSTGRLATVHETKAPRKGKA